MYTAHPVDRFQMVKIEQQHRVGRAHRTLSATSTAGGPQHPRTLPVRRRVALAAATFLVSLGLLAGVAIAGNGTANTPADACEKFLVGGRIVC